MFTKKDLISGTTGDYYHNSNQGWTGTFTNGDGATVSVSGGIVYNVA